MRIVAIGCSAGDLRPGDLWSSVGPEFWDQAHMGELDEVGHRAVGVKVYIRTEAQPAVMAQNLTQVWRLHIIPDDVQATIGLQAARDLIEDDEKDITFSDWPALHIVNEQEEADDRDLDGD